MTRKLVFLSKLMAAKGWGSSTREAEKFIDKGWVRVNGAIAQRGERVTETVSIELSRIAKNYIRERSTAVMLNKPRGVVGGGVEEYGYEDHNRPAKRLLTADNYIKLWESDRMEPLLLPNLKPAGRLCTGSTGLLLFTQCDTTLRRVETVLEKEYIVLLKPENRSPLTLYNKVISESLEKLCQGVFEKNGDYLEAESIDIVSNDQLRIVLKHEEEHHIYRMLKAVGWKMQACNRVRVGKLKLNDDLLRGCWRYLHRRETVEDQQDQPVRQRSAVY